MLRMSENLQPPNKHTQCPSVIPVSSASNSGKGQDARQRTPRCELTGAGSDERQAGDEGVRESTALELLELHGALTALQGESERESVWTNVHGCVVVRMQ